MFERLGQRDATVALVLALDRLEQLMPEHHVVLGRVRRRLVLERRQRVLDQLPLGLGARALGRGAEQQRALGELPGEVALAGLQLALELVAPGAEQVGPGLDRELPAPGPIDAELAAPPHAVDVGVDPVQRRLLPAAVARAAVADHGAQLVVAVAEDVGRHGDDVADAPLDRDSGRRRRSEPDTGSRSASGVGRRSGGALASEVSDSARQLNHHLVNILPRSCGIQLHITSLPGGRLGPEAYRFVDWLEAAGQAWWQVLPLGPPDRHRSPYKSRSAFAAWPGLLGEPGAAVSAAEIADFRERNAYWIDDWERASRPRRGRRPGPLRSRVDRAARLRGRAGSPDHRRRPDLRRPRQRRPPRPSRALPRRRRGGHAAGHVLGHRPAVGQPALRLARAAAAAIRLVDGASAPHARAVRPRADRPLPRLRRLLGGARRARGPRCDGRWCRGPGASLFEALERELGTLPLVAEDLGVITPAVEQLRDALGLPGMLVLQFAFDPEDPDQNPHDPANHRENRLVYTGTHDTDTARGWYDVARPRAARAAGPRARAPGDLRARALVGPDPPRARVPGPDLDDAGPGRARPRQRAPA